MQAVLDLEKRVYCTHSYTFTVLVNFPEGGTIVRHSNGVFTEEDGSSVAEYVFSRVELVRTIISRGKN